ncbi:MAG: WD40 repeat domain-containing protein, partial [Ferruginibacter sp.]|nr:WD40 repeat domain-containing protein [Ferruginibacter sp.]
MKQRPSTLLFIALLFTICIQAQVIVPMPAFVLSKDDAAVCTSLYVPDSNHIMVFRQNKCWWFTLQGKLLRGPVVINSDGEDIRNPRISPSGKTLFSYIPGEDFLQDNELKVFNFDSGYTIGSYKTTSRSRLDRIRFMADSLLNFYTHYDDFKGNYTWDIMMGKVNFQSVREDSSHSGVYDLAYYQRKVLIAIRYKDTVGLVTMDRAFPEVQHFEFFKLSSENVTNYAQFTGGFPYLLLGDATTGVTRIFKPGDTSFKQVGFLQQLPEIIAASGTENNCYILYRDTSMPLAPLCKLLNVETKQELVLPFDPLHLEDFVFSIDPSQSLVIASHLSNGSILAFNFLKNKFEWQFLPPEFALQPINNFSKQADNKLFKVLIKQGSQDVTKTYFDLAHNQLYLIKNNDKLITVDADSKCATKWESFYQGDHRVSDATLLPGWQYICYTEERWKKDPTASKKNYLNEIEYDENLPRKDFVYPYATKVYNRALKKIVFSLQTMERLEVDIINDSLVCWAETNNDIRKDSVIIFNLNTGVSSKSKPLPGSNILGFTAKMISNKLYYAVALPERELAIVNDKARVIFRRKYKDERDVLQQVAFVGNSPYFYFEDFDKNALNHLYKIVGDTVEMIRKFPANISLLACTLTDAGCYFMYKKEVVRKSGTFMHFRLLNMLAGTDNFIDSVNDDDDRGVLAYELYPAEGFYTRNQSSILSWHDLNNGYEFKDFGRDEPTLSSIAYSPDGRYLASANPNGRVLLWDLGTGKETRTLVVEKNGYISKLAFSGDGAYLAASSGDIWECASGKNVVSVTDGSIWAVNSIDFSSDGKRIVSGGACIISWDASDGSKLKFQQEPGKDGMDTTGTCWNPNGCVDPNFKFQVFSIALHPNSRDFVAGNKNGVVQRWNTENDSLYAYKMFANIEGQPENKVYDLKYTRDGKSIIAVQEKCLYRLNALTLKVEDSLFLPEGEKLLGIDMGYDGNTFGCITERRHGRIVQLRNIADLALIKEFYTEGISFNKLSFSPNKKQAATASDDGFCTIWDIENGKEVMYLNSIGEYGNLMVTPDNYYMASKSALDGVSFLKDSSFYSFDQFDLYLNRPDIVLSRLGYAAPELLNFYRTAYFKRLKKATGDIKDTVMSETIPRLKLLDRKSIAAVSKSGTANLRFEITDAAAEHGSLRIYINGNLVKENNATNGSKIFVIEDSVYLGQGKNNVEAVYSNRSSAESRKEKIIITYSPSIKIAPKVWFIGVGISNYQDATMNLKYPVKDIRDITRDFKRKYPGLVIDTLLNEKATRDQLLALREKLMKTDINDKVIVSFSGHGLLSDSLNWYFATYDIDLKKPEVNGLSYAMMEGILDGIPARQ